MKHLNLVCVAAAVSLAAMSYSSSSVANAAYHYTCQKSKWAGYVWHRCELPTTSHGGYNWVIPGHLHRGTKGFHAAGCQLNLEFPDRTVKIEASASRYIGWQLFLPMTDSQGNPMQYSPVSFYEWPRDLHTGAKPVYECYEQSDSVAESFFTVTSIITMRI